MTRVKTVDPKSADLAAFFMADAPPIPNAQTHEDFTEDLAITIQQAVEDWFEARARNGWVPIFEPVPPGITA